MVERERTSCRSAEAYERALGVLVGGVNSPVRAYRDVGHGPPFIASAKGSKVYDIDGNEYIDYVGSWGPMVAGHSHPAVVKAVCEQAERGTSFGAPTVAETELAERIVSRFGSVDKVRLLSSGTEAVMSAVRLARGYTGRERIIKMEGCYHGHSDCLLVAAGSGAAGMTEASSAGVPGAVAGLTSVVPYNDAGAVEEAFGRWKGEVAAVLVEPVAANMGVVLPAEGYLERIGQLCREEGALFILDEVITGFRLAGGGAQELFGVEADITCLGKIAGGGLPLAAVGGRAEIMDVLAPLGPVYQAGTLSGNPVATAAANATLDLLAGSKCYEQLERVGGFLADGIMSAARKAGVAISINRVGSIMSCFFTDKPVRNFSDVQATNIKQFKAFFGQMLKEGIYLAPSAYEAMFISLAHSEADVEKTIMAAEKALKSACSQK